MAEKLSTKALEDFKGLLSSSLKKSEWLHGLTKQWNSYEKRVKSLVKELDLKSRDAREKSRKQLDGFAKQLHQTRTDLEKKVVGLVNVEASRLNQGFTELVTYLKSLSKNEKLNKVEAKTKSKSASSTKSSRKSSRTSSPSRSSASSSSTSSSPSTSSKGKAKKPGRSKVVSGRKASLDALTDRSSGLSSPTSGPISH